MADHITSPHAPPNGTRGGPGEAHARVAHLLDEMGDLYFTLDRGWRFTHLNRNALAQAARPAEELLGRSLWEVYPELLQTPLEAHYRRALATGETVRFEIRGLHSDRWYEVHACPSPGGLTVYSRDITERKRAEEALRESEQHFRAISALTSDYTYVCRIDPSGRSVLVAVSEGFHAVTGYTLAEIEERGGWEVLIHPDDDPVVHHSRVETVAGRPWTGELRLVTRRGETRWIRTSAWPVLDPVQGRVVSLLGAAQDITERKQAEEALRESEQRHRALSELTSDYTYSCRVEPDGRVTLEAASQGFRTVTGYTVEEVEARGGPAVLVFPEDRPAVEKLVREVTVRRSWEGELRIVTRQGEVRWVRSAAWPVSGPDPGGVVRVLGAVQDITERKRAELALRASEELNRRILQSVHAGIVTIAPDGSILQANAEGQRILGLSWDELSSKFIGDFEAVTFWEDGSPCPAAEYPVSKCLATGAPQPGVTIGVRRPDGEISWGVFTAAPLLDPETARPCGAVVTFVDITQRKRTEEALRESEERLRRFFQAAFEGLVIHEGGTIRDANRPFAEMFGYELDEVLGRHVTEFGAPAERERVRAALREGRELPYEGLGLRKDGTTFPVELCGKNIPSDGRTLRVTALRDITERKRAEAQLRDYADRLQTLSRRLMEVQETERRHLARELHDEIGQALTGLQLALKASADLPPERRAEGLVRAQKLVTELTGQIRDLSQSLRPTMLDDLGLLPALLWHFRRYTAQTGIRVDFEHHGLGRRFPPEVETAAYRIVQEALTNVARHAGVGSAAVAVGPDGEVLRLRVADRGPGFNVGAVRAGGGNGLSGMEERAALLGGQLVVQSTPGAGTCLTAELPLGGSAERGQCDADVVVGG
jgi:PAS domain S-box-containing protein